MSEFETVSVLIWFEARIVGRDASRKTGAVSVRKGLAIAGGVEKLHQCMVTRGSRIKISYIYPL
ncbi:MAG TPA: hypothetical protein VIW95_10095 [Candidatus Binatus sp.]|uniref:hypothetical protein n=1 Tax=Candidatus Binatus sp. TaxID=2811406 RepID=UPI002F3FDF23